MINIELNLTTNQPITNQDFQPNITTLKNYFSQQGVVGETTTSILTTFCVLGRQCSGIESLAGSGKTVISDAVLSLLPDKYIYEVGVGSATSMAYQQNEINKAFIIYIPELQKANQNEMVTEILKNWGEKKNFDRTVTQTYNAGQGFKRHVEKQHLKKKHFIYTLALENKHKKDEELSRRVLTFTTDITSKQNKRVIKSIGTRRSRKKLKKIINTEEVTSLKNHCKSVADLTIKGVYDPFGEAFSEQVPEGFTIVRSYIGHYFNLVDASAKFHYKNRLIKDGQLIINLEDYKVIHELFALEFNHRIHNLPNMGKDILKCYDQNEGVGYKINQEKSQQTLYSNQENNDDKAYLSVADIHKLLKKRNLLVKHKVIQDQIDLLIEAGFLAERKIGKTNTYYQQDILTDFDESFDWKKFYEQALKVFEQEEPELLNEWKKMNDVYASSVKLFENKIVEEEGRVKPPKTLPKSSLNSKKSLVIATLEIMEELPKNKLLHSCQLTEKDYDKLLSEGLIYEPLPSIARLVNTPVKEEII